MKKVLLTTLTLSTINVMECTAQPAVAPCPCPQAFQGFHFGGNVGYGFGGVKINQTSITPNGTTTSTSATSNVRVKGFDGGLNVGYTHRFGNFGLGIEGVFNWANSKDRTTA